MISDDHKFVDRLDVSSRRTYHTQIYIYLYSDFGMQPNVQLTNTVQFMNKYSKEVKQSCKNTYSMNIKRQNFKEIRRKIYAHTNGIYYAI